MDGILTPSQPRYRRIDAGKIEVQENVGDLKASEQKSRSETDRAESLPSLHGTPRLANFLHRDDCCPTALAILMICRRIKYVGASW